VSILLHSFEIKHLAEEFRAENNQECIIKKTIKMEDAMKKQEVIITGTKMKDEGSERGCRSYFI